MLGGNRTGPDGSGVELFTPYRIDICFGLAKANLPSSPRKCKRDSVPKTGPMKRSFIQKWISDMGIDGPIFVPKSGYFLLIWVKVCPQKLAFSKFFSQFYEMAFLTECWLFKTRNSPLSLFLDFLAVVLSQFCSNIV